MTSPFRADARSRPRRYGATSSPPENGASALLPTSLVERRRVDKQPVVSVQQWKIAPQLERVAGLRRAVVAYAGGQGVEREVLDDLALAVSAVVANVVRSSRHVGSSAPVWISVDVAEDG